jgi:hypothetical protein
MKISYYLNEGRKKNLYCRISDGTERVSFSLGYAIDPTKWNVKEEEGSVDDPYYFVLRSFREYLSKRYHELKSEGLLSVLTTLKSEAESFMVEEGIDGIAQKLFDDENKEDGIPAYDEFIQAFEKYSGLEKGDYAASPLDNLVQFHTKKSDVFEIDTYEGLSARLKSFIDRKSYEEIQLMTDHLIWREIYIDTGIEKHVFLPKILNEWEILWARLYETIQKEVGKTNHLDKMKSQSWRKFQVFMECYNDVSDVIDLALEIDDSDLYPIAVISMVSILGEERCWSEYCESEFAKKEWESIDFEDEAAEDEPVFFIRIPEM